jgi:hypothetical protein
VPDAPLRLVSPGPRERCPKFLDSFRGPLVGKFGHCGPETTQGDRNASVMRAVGRGEPRRGTGDAVQLLVARRAYERRSAVSVAEDTGLGELEVAWCYESRSMFNIAHSIASHTCSAEAEWGIKGTIRTADYWIWVRRLRALNTLIFGCYSLAPLGCRPLSKERLLISHKPRSNLDWATDRRTARAQGLDC